MVPVCRLNEMDKSYYIPTVAEVDEFYETGALLSDKAYQDMFRFLEKEMADFGPGNMPVIAAGSSHAAEVLAQIAPDPCGSGKKYKKCCGRN